MEQKFSKFSIRLFHAKQFYSNNNVENILQNSMYMTTWE